MSLGETLATFFQRILEFAPDFQETNVYEPNFATFFWWFPFYCFDILLAVLMNLNVIFDFGLEIKPCESRLEFVHLQKLKKTEKQMIKQQKKTIPKRTKKIHCLQNLFFLLFLRLWV